MKRNQAGQHLSFQENSLANGVGLTGLTGIVVSVEIDGGGLGPGNGGVSAETNGTYKYLFTQAETDGYHIAVQVFHPQAITQVFNIYTDDGLEVEVGKIVKTGEEVNVIQQSLQSSTDVNVIAARV